MKTKANSELKPRSLSAVEVNSELRTPNSELDLVYTLGTGSQWQNNEIRYSIRSIIKNLTGYRNIYIIGETPTFLTPLAQVSKVSQVAQVAPLAPLAQLAPRSLSAVEVPNFELFTIPHPDEIGPHNADGNIIRKLIRACAIPELSDDFIFLNDDNYFIKPIHVNDIYPFYKGNLDTMDPNIFASIWGRRLGRTRYHISKQGFTPLHFDHHSPIKINKHLFPEIVSQFDYASEIGLTVKSIYASVAHPNAKLITTEEAAIFKPSTLEQINIITKNALYMAHNDKSLTDSLKYWLWQQFNQPSPYEHTPPDDKIINIAEWDQRGRDYSEGVKLFTRYNKHQRNLTQLYQKNESSTLRKKLNYHFNSILKTL
jgi:hypothetical protein